MAISQSVIVKVPNGGISTKGGISSSTKEK